MSGLHFIQIRLGTGDGDLRRRQHGAGIVLDVGITLRRRTHDLILQRNGLGDVLVHLDGVIALVVQSDKLHIAIGRPEIRRKIIMDAQPVIILGQLVQIDPDVEGPVLLLHQVGQQ